ncbi:SWA2 [Symbiodinium sp. CCMP2592]|nr:SWA2 [Symbiodinium sp. CCMP2592]
MGCLCRPCSLQALIISLTIGLGSLLSARVALTEEGPAVQFHSSCIRGSEVSEFCNHTCSLQRNGTALHTLERQLAGPCSALLEVIQEALGGVQGSWKGRAEECSKVAEWVETQMGPHTAAKEEIDDFDWVVVFHCARDAIVQCHFDTARNLFAMLAKVATDVPQEIAAKSFYYMFGLCSAEHFPGDHRDMLSCGGKSLLAESARLGKEEAMLNIGILHLADQSGSPFLRNDTEGLRWLQLVEGSAKVSPKKLAESVRRRYEAWSRSRTQRLKDVFWERTAKILEPLLLLMVLYLCYFAMHCCCPLLTGQKHGRLSVGSPSPDFSIYFADGLQRSLHELVLHPPATTLLVLYHTVRTSQDQEDPLAKLLGELEGLDRLLEGIQARCVIVNVESRSRFHDIDASGRFANLLHGHAVPPKPYHFSGNLQKFLLDSTCVIAKIGAVEVADLQTVLASGSVS